MVISTPHRSFRLAPCSLQGLRDRLTTSNERGASATGITSQNINLSFENDPLPAQSYTKRGCLGSGRNGNVYEYYCEGKSLAVKKVYHGGNDKIIASCLKEASIHNFVHNQIPGSTVELLEVKADSGCVYIIEEKGPKTLEDLAVSGSIDLEDMPAIANKCLFLLEKVHGIGVAHNDIKLSNFLAEQDSNGEWNILLIDFGASTIGNHGSADVKWTIPDIISSLLIAYKRMKLKGLDAREQKLIANFKEQYPPSWMRC